MLTRPVFSPLHQTRRLFELYTYYRVALVIALWLIDSGQYTHDLTGNLHPIVFTSVLFFYGFYQGLLLFLLRDTHFPHRVALLLNAIIDITVLALLTYSSGGLGSGLGSLMIAAIAASNVLLIGRIGLFVAAYATLNAFAIEIYLSFVRGDTERTLFQAGILGALYFMTSLFIQYLGKRAQQTEAIAQRQALDLADLEELNHLIIQRLRMGIIVIDERLQVRTMNEMARIALGGHIARIPEALQERLIQWRKDPNERPTLFRLSDSLPEIQANFALMTFDSREHVIIFLEDAAQLAQQAQQLKLASLGRLTASIAHEIRNPLGAISHAAQLLEESSHLDKADRHLLEVINKHTTRVNHIIEDILTVSRQSAPRPDIFDLKSWVHTFISDYHSTQPNACLYTEITTDDLMIRIDQQHLTQVLTNLCDNGLRYSYAHTGHANLLLRGGVLKENGRPYLDVIDEGNGISLENQRHLFEPFYTTEARGTGLGLYICKGLCELNQASLDYVDQPGGACFRLIFAHPQRIIN